MKSSGIRGLIEVVGYGAELGYEADYESEDHRDGGYDAGAEALAEYLGDEDDGEEDEHDEQAVGDEVAGCCGSDLDDGPAKVEGMPEERAHKKDSEKEEELEDEEDGFFHV